MATAAEKRALTNEIKEYKIYLKDLKEAKASQIKMVQATHGFFYYLGDKIHMWTIDKVQGELNSLIKKRNSLDK